jgi:hydrogenase maturation factor
MSNELFAVHAAGCERDADGHCITCSDEAVTIQVLRVDAETGIALVTPGDKAEEVDITLVEDVAPGDRLLVHGGVVIASVENHDRSDGREANDA